MEDIKSKPLLLSSFFFFFLGTASLARAHILDFDESWEARAKEAREEVLASYHPDPESVTDHLNEEVHRSTEGGNSTRRHLRRYTGPCLATNPIDRCWRCQKNWANNRKQLASCALGFGRKALGGKNGRYYVVTDPSDDDMLNPRPGTLRYAVIQKEPLWIIFARDMIIRLSQELMVNSYKTIDGRGSNVHIAHGASINIQFAHHVIIHGLHIHDIKSGSGGMIRDSVEHFGQRGRSDGDGISIFGSSNIWVDHVSMSNCMDGLIDVVQASTAITISNNHFTNHDHVMLFGASDSYPDDAIMQVTVAFNHFGRGLVQRMPRCRWGFFHVLNNDYTHWIMYAIGGSQHPTIISQGNRYIAPKDQKAKEVTHRVDTWDQSWTSWKWRSEGDIMQNGAFFVQSGSSAKQTRFSKKDMITAKPGSFVTRLTRFAGALNCRVNKAC